MIIHGQGFKFEQLIYNESEINLWRKRVALMVFKRWEYPAEGKQVEHDRFFSKNKE